MLAKDLVHIGTESDHSLEQLPLIPKEIRFQIKYLVLNLKGCMMAKAKTSSVNTLSNNFDFVFVMSNSIWTQMSLRFLSLL